jgi:hypothetical protein
VLALTLMVNSVLTSALFLQGNYCLQLWTRALGIDLHKQKLSHLIANFAQPHIANVGEAMQAVLTDHAITYIYSACRLLHHGLSQQVSLYLNLKNSFLENGNKVQNHIISHRHHARAIILSWTQTQVVMNL